MASISNIIGNTFLLTFTAAESIDLYSMDFSTGDVTSSYLDTPSITAIRSSLYPLVSALTLAEQTAGGTTLILSPVTVAAINGSVNLTESVTGTIHTLRVTSIGAVQCRVTVAHTVQGGFVGGVSQNQGSEGALNVLRGIYFGDSSNLTDLTVTGATTLSTLDSYRNITISGAGVLRSLTGRVLAWRNLTFNGTGAGAITNEKVAGANAAGATAGGGGSFGSTAVITNFYPPQSGAAGGAGGVNAGGTAGTLGVSTIFPRTPAAVGSSVGGSGGAGSAGAGGTTSAIANAQSRNFPMPPIPNPIISISYNAATVVQFAGFAGTGGGGGGGSGAISGGGGGGGGSSGGGLYVGARNIIRLNSPASPCINLVGGAGGNGADGLGANAGGGGGGGGGSGGHLSLVYEVIDSNTVSPFLAVTGGTGGNGGLSGGGAGVDGRGGKGGDSGRYQTLNISTGVGTTSAIGIIPAPPADRNGSAGATITLSI